MSRNAVTDEHHATEISTSPTNALNETETVNVKNDKVTGKTTKNKRNIGQSLANFIYDARRRTVLGRSSLNWARLAAFYTIFYLLLGCFFTGYLYLFALNLDRDEPRYYDTDSVMAVRTTATVVGMGFRPQPVVSDNLIQVTDNIDQKTRIASSLRLYRDVYLTQKSDAKTEPCTREEPASELPPGTACLFNWFHIVNTDNHPCSDNNMYGFKNEQPCILVKLNKVYGWTPSPGRLPWHIQERRAVFSNRTESNPNVYITCDGSNPADKDVLTDITYYSLDNPTGSPKYGAIPNYYFPYRNAPDHVQPFVLVQFKNLPVNRLVAITCRAWAPNMEHDSKAMRGMVNFQLYRSHSNTNSNDDDDDDN